MSRHRPIVAAEQKAVKWRARSAWSWRRVETHPIVGPRSIKNPEQEGLMVDLTEQTATEVVLEELTRGGSPRMKEILTSLITHLHGFVRDVGLTE